MDPSLSRELCPWLLRRRFNEFGPKERVRAGELQLEIVASHHVRRGDLPRGTMSQIVRYVDRRGRVVAVAHRYRARNGVIVGGREDPKFLVLNSEAFKSAHDDDESCGECAHRMDGRAGV